MSEDRGHLSWVRDPSMPQGADSIALVGASELEQEQANVDFISYARTDIPLLLDYIDYLLSERDAIAAAFETVTVQDGTKKPSHALHNLEVAIVDIERSGNHADAISMRTLHRVAEQLAAIARAMRGNAE